MALGFKFVQAAGVFAAHLACSSWALADWQVAAGAVGGGAKPRAVFGVVPYAGSRARALRDAAAALTIPLTPITFTASKTNTSYTDTIVGYSPFPKGKVGETITMVVVPVVVQIGSTNFDPTAPDSCIAKDVSPLAALQGSPLLNPVTFDGQNVAGHASLVNGVNIGSAGRNSGLMSARRRNITRISPPCLRRPLRSARQRSPISAAARCLPRIARRSA
jgi:hypothetical protein